MPPDLWLLYELMFKSRLFEEAVTRLWNDGEIPGEMHLGVGEEAIVAGVVSQMKEGDAMALDHRGTPPMLMRGVDPVALLCEFMGKDEGLCHGLGGHMHLFNPERLAASSGIVGSSGPAAVGFALAGQMLRPGTISIAFFGEGATNAGMLMESMNLAVAWNLQVIFVCKDNQLAISTPSSTTGGGSLLARAQSFGMKVWEVDGSDVMAMASIAEDAFNHTRAGHGPAFILASCVHLKGHFLGDPLMDMQRRPVFSLLNHFWPILKSFFQKGSATARERFACLQQILALSSMAQRQTDLRHDPVSRARQMLWKEDPARLGEMESSIRSEIQNIAALARQSEGRAA